MVKIMFIIAASAPWLIIFAAGHYTLRRKWRAYRNYFALRELRKHRVMLLDLYRNMTPEAFVAIQKTVLRNIARLGDKETPYAALMRDILAEAMEHQLNRPDNV